MKTNRILKCLTFCLAALTTPLIASEWTAGGGNTDWSTTANWNNPAGPAGTDVLFGAAGATNSSTPATSVVNSNYSILSLTYQYNSAANFQTTEILNGVTLTVGGTTNVFTVGGLSGTGTPIQNTTVVIKGDGKLNIDQNGGVITIANHRLQDTPTAPYTASLDMSGLASFEANLGSTGSFNVGASQPSNASGSHQNTSSTVRLAEENTITAGALRVGSVIPNSQISIGVVPSNLYLGIENTLNVDVIHVGRSYASRASGHIAFDASVLDDSPEVIIRGLDGVSAVSEMKIGVNDSAGTSNPFAGSVDFSGGRVDALITNLTIANANASGTGVVSSLSGSLTMDEGTITAMNVLIGQGRGANTNASTITVGAVNINGDGVFNAANLTLAARTGGDQRVSGTLNITDTAAVTVTNGIVMGNSAAGSTPLTATVNVDGGSLTAVSGNIAKGSGSGIASTLNLRGGNLNLNGNNIAVDTFNAESGTLRNVGQFNGGANLVKTTSGTLTIAGTNTYTGATVVDAGTVNLSGSLSQANATVKSASQFNLLDTGTLQFNITGIGTADSFVVDAGGFAAFDGTLRFNLVSDFGDVSWQLFTGTSAGNFANLSDINVSGAFAGSLSNLGGDIWGTTIGMRILEFDAGNGMFSVSTIPEPGVFALMAFGALALLTRRRR